MSAAEPRSAADPKSSAWVSANAGAGKTHTLANRVTRLLLDGAKPERILCLTYTKAAAAEMAGRLFDRLGKWAMAPDDKLMADIAEIGAPVPGAEGLRETRRLFAQALETPGGLKIQTIHAFCQYLLTRFPREAGVSPAFRVLDDSTARALLDTALNRTLEKAGLGDRRISEALGLLVTETSEARLDSIIGAALGSDRRKLERFLAQFPLHDGALSDAIRRAHGAEDGDSADAVEAQFLATVKEEEAKLREVAEWLGRGKSSDAECAERLLTALRLSSFEKFCEIFLTRAGDRRKRLATKELAERNAAHFAYFESVHERFLAADERRRAAHAAALADAAFVLVRAVRDEYENAKRNRSALDYDDLIVATQRLLERTEAAQWVLYKLDGGLDHVLIDEAQDTSPEQWAIVKRLTEEFFAGEGNPRRASRTIFAVGDEKQSIFSFQGAEPGEFEIHRRYFAERIAGESFADVRLDTSRRSAPEILQFVDKVFASPEAREGVVSGQDPLVHRPHRTEAKGRVELWPLLCPLDRPETDPWRPIDAPSLDSPVARLAEALARQIEDWTDGRKCLPGRARPIRPGDILILTPRREPFAGAIIRALKTKHIPVAGADRIRLTEQIAVMDFVALGRFALLPEDDLNLAALLRSPLIGLSEDELSALCVGRKDTLWRALQQQDGACYRRAAAVLSAILSAADFAPPYEFYQAFLSQRGVRKRMLDRLGTEAADPIDEFLSQALSYETLNTPSLEGFLHWIEHGEADVKRDMERARDEVRVMTVHGAKGLESDIVILPDTASLPGRPGGYGEILYTDNGPVFPARPDMTPRAVRQAKELAAQKIREEYRRLLYVALTRARERLYICGFRGKRALRGDSWYSLAETAAREIGVAVARGDETFHVLGDGQFEQVGDAEREEEKLVLADWMLRAAPEAQGRPRLLRPSDAAGADEPGVLSPLGARNAQRFRRGNLVHALLALLPDIEPGGRLKAAERFLRRRGIGAEEASALAEETLRVIDDPAFAPAFSPNSRAEVAIVADLPEVGRAVRASGRIDRLAVADTEVLAVDFKTDRPAPARPDAIPAVYRAQMALYRAALERIFPAHRISCALLWTDAPKLMRLDDALLDEELRRIADRLDRSESRS